MSSDNIIYFGGIGVNYRVYEPIDIKHRVLIIPGPLSDINVWESITETLVENDCLVLCVDLPGFGKSDKGEDIPMDPETRAKIMWGIIDYVDNIISLKQCSWNIISHGSSALTAFSMEMQNPESVVSQVLICPVLKMPHALPFNISPTDKQILNWYDKNIVPPIAFKDLFNSMFRRTLTNKELSRLHTPLKEPGAREQMVNLVREGYSYEKNSVKGFAPLMVLLGEKDTYTHPDFVGKAIESRSGNREMHVMKLAGHFPMYTHYRELGDYLRGWLRDMDE